MKKNIRNPLFIAILATFSLSEILEASSFGDSEPPHKKWRGISMRAGIGTVQDQEEIRKQQEEQYRRAAHKMLAEAAQDKAAVAQHVFAFKHNFLIPSWLRDALPDEVSSQLLNLNMHDVQLRIEGELSDKTRVTSALLRVNGLGEDLLAATMRPESRFIRLINESGFKQESNPLSIAKSLFALAMRLDEHIFLGITRTQAENMMGALYYAASEKVISTFDNMSDETIDALFAPEVLVDSYTSAGQLRRWAAHRINDPQKKFAYTVDSLKLFEKARGYASQTDFFEKIKQDQHFAYDLLEELLLKTSASEDSVKRFIASRHATI